MKLCACYWETYFDNVYLADVFIIEDEEECKREDAYCYIEVLNGEDEDYDEEEYDEDDVEIEEDGEKLWWEAEEADDP
jgi:hypothetical protein